MKHDHPGTEHQTRWLRGEFLQSQRSTLKILCFQKKDADRNNNNYYLMMMMRNDVNL